MLILGYICLAPLLLLLFGGMLALLGMLQYAAWREWKERDEDPSAYVLIVAAAFVDCFILFFIGVYLLMLAGAYH